MNPPFKYYASAWKGGSRAKIVTYNVTKWGTGLGYLTSGVGVGFGIYNFVMSDQSWGDYGAFGMSLLSSGLTLGTYTAPIGIAIGIIDATHGFDDFYKYLDNNENLYNKTGMIIIPNYIGIPIFIPLK